MTDWLLDTNVLSELRRPKPSANVLAFISKQPLERLFVSEVSFAEIRFGIELGPDRFGAPSSSNGSRTRSGRCSLGTCCRSART